MWSLTEIDVVAGFKLFFVWISVGSVTCGTTWHAAGLTAVLGGGIAQIRMLQYAIDLFPQLEKETGMGTGEWSAQTGEGSHPLSFQ